MPEGANVTYPSHTVEKVGGTTMSRIGELIDPLFKRGREGKDLYGRIFVVSAFGGITNLLLEHKKSGEPGVYALFASADDDHGWLDALTRVAQAMREAHEAVLTHPADRAAANEFVRERIEGARSCLIDLQRLCSYGHFRLADHMMMIRELLSGLGEAHSAFTAAQLLQRNGVDARFVDLTGWRDDAEVDLDERLRRGLSDIDLSEEMPIVTGYAQCREGLMREFDRGYSEVTFSRLAAMTGAREAIIHKEFHLSSADPNLVGADAVQKLGHTNYDVADQLSNLGMEAIHPKAGKTLRQAEIPLRVTNAFEPDDPGTLIDDALAETPGVEIVTGLNVISLELHEPDMVGVKGYDAAILEVLKRHKVRIVSKTSNANTITHFIDTSLKVAKRVERDLEEIYPSAAVSLRNRAIASVVGRDLTDQRVLTRGLIAMEKAGIEVLAAHQSTRNVDAQFLLVRDDLAGAIKAMHAEFCEAGETAKLAA